MYDAYPQQIIECGMADAWRKAPVSFEVCWVMQHWKDQGWDIDYIIEQSLKWHISSFNAKSSAVPREWRPVVDQWLKRMGYRLVLRKFACPQTVRRGESLSYSSWWENKGVAPCYRPFRLALRIRRDDFSRVLPLDADIRAWLPGDSLANGAVTLPADALAGTYELETGILDERSDQPRVQIAIEGRTGDGWYPIGNIRIRERS